MKEGILFLFLSPWGPPHLCRQAFDERRQRTIDDTLDWENSVVVVVISFVTPIFNDGDRSGDWLWDSWRHFFMQIHKLWQKSHQWWIANAMVFLTVLWRMLTGLLATNHNSHTTWFLTSASYWFYLFAQLNVKFFSLFIAPGHIHFLLFQSKYCRNLSRCASKHALLLKSWEGG